MKFNVIVVIVFFGVLVKPTNLFSQKPLPALIPYRMEEKWGYSDSTQKIIVPCTYDFVDTLSEDMALVFTGNKYGFVNKTGKVVVAPQFDYALPFKDGVAMVRNNKFKWGMIDKTGKFLVPYKYDEGGWADNQQSCQEGLVKVQVNGKMGFIDCTGYLHDRNGQYG